MSGSQSRSGLCGAESNPFLSPGIRFQLRLSPFHSLVTTGLYLGWVNNEPEWISKEPAVAWFELLTLRLSGRTEKRKSTCGSLPWNPPTCCELDNRSATLLICKCSLLCNNIPIATRTRYSTAPSALL
jgi:hypothetical protein